MSASDLKPEPWWRVLSGTNGLLAIVLLLGAVVVLIQQTTSYWAVR